MPSLGTRVGKSDRREAASSFEQHPHAQCCSSVSGTTDHMISLKLRHTELSAKLEEWPCTNLTHVIKLCPDFGARAATAETSV